MEREVSLALSACSSVRIFYEMGVMPLGQHPIRRQLFRRLRYDDNQMDNMPLGGQPDRQQYSSKHCLFNF